VPPQSSQRVGWNPDGLLVHGCEAVEGDPGPIGQIGVFPGEFVRQEASRWLARELGDRVDELHVEGETRFTDRESRDVVWTLCSLAVHDLLVVARGWTSERYQEWLTEVLPRELLPDDRA